MAKKPTADMYKSVALLGMGGDSAPEAISSPAETPPAPTSLPTPAEVAPMQAPKRSTGSRQGGNIKDKSSPVLLYLHPAGHKALKRYALEADRKVHDLLLEAVEEWASGKGIAAPIRFSSKGAQLEIDPAPRKHQPKS